MRSAIEDWGGVEIWDGIYHQISDDENYWMEIDECPWCGAKLPEPPEEIEGITFEEAEQFYGTKESEE
jgi:hypothetical protein